MSSLPTNNLAESFLALHTPGTPLIMPNPWDEGTAKLLAALGFKALATTSQGHAFALGRQDGTVTRDEAIAHGSDIVQATPLPVSADLEQCFADDPDGVVDTIRMAADTGLAGCSIEDFDRTSFYDRSLAVERVAAAAEVARSSEHRIVLTARADGFMRRAYDFDETVARLVAYADAGADVVYAPGITDAEQLRAICDTVPVPVNYIAIPGGLDVAAAADAGAARISVGTTFCLAALDGLATAATELLEHGTTNYMANVARGHGQLNAALSYGVGS